MSDAIFIGVMIVFFLLCTLYVQLCDRMIGSDELAMPAQGTDSDPDGEPAHRQRGESAFGVQNQVAARNPF